VGWRNHGILKNYWSNLLVLYFCSVFYVTSFLEVSHTHIYACRNIHLWTIFLYYNFLNIFCIRLIMRKYNSESYLRRNIITNPIFHFSVELKFAKHANQDEPRCLQKFECCEWLILEEIFRASSLGIFVPRDWESRSKIAVPSHTPVPLGNP
jgi:hypothetical protein